MLGSYDIVMRMAESLVLAASSLASDSSRAKFMRFGRGQHRCTLRVRHEAASLPKDRPTVWFHCASLGEYGIARPIISELKRRSGCNVALTFFSPTGYEALKSKGSVEGGPDAVWYLPLDTRRNATRFLDALKPDCAVFMVSEYWHNYLHLLHERHIPSLLVSAIIREDGPFFKWYGSLYRKSIQCFDSIYALDGGSAERLRLLGVGNVKLNGDPLFDNAALVAHTPWSNPIMERFVDGRKTFIAGSLHHDQDLELVAELANDNPSTPFIIVPHEITSSTLRAIEQALQGKSVRLSECGDDTSFKGVQALIVDSVGSLAYLYRYGTWAYVGGGFTRLLHSVIEPVVYGLPVAFGPEIRRKVTPRELEELGIGKRVENASQLALWFRRLQNDNLLELIRNRADAYVARNTGATPRVVDAIMDRICGKK